MNNPNVSIDELKYLASNENILQSFGLADDTCIEQGRPMWQNLDDTASIAVKRYHVPCCPGLCGDIFFIFGQCPSEAFVFIKLHDGTWRDLTRSY